MHKNHHDSENDFSTGITSKKLEDRKTVLRGPSSRSWSHARAATWKDKSQLNIQLFTDGYEVKYHQHCHHVIMFTLTLSNNTKVFNTMKNYLVYIYGGQTYLTPVLACL